MRRNTVCIALSRRVVAFSFGMDDGGPREDISRSKGKSRSVGKGFWLEKLGEWETAQNEQGRSNTELHKYVD